MENKETELKFPTAKSKTKPLKGENRLVIEACLNCEKPLVLGKTSACQRCMVNGYCTSTCRKADFQTHKKKMCDLIMEKNKMLETMEFGVFLSHHLGACKKDVLSHRGFEIIGIMKKDEYDLTYVSQEEKDSKEWKHEIQSLEKDKRDVVYYLLEPSDKRTMADTYAEFVEQGIENIFWSVFGPDMNDAVAYGFVNSFHKLRKMFGTKLYFNHNGKNSEIVELDIEAVRVHKKFEDDRENHWTSSLPVFLLKDEKNTDPNFRHHVTPDLTNLHCVVSLKILQANSIAKSFFLDFASSQYSFQNIMENAPFPIMLYDETNFSEELDICIREDENGKRSRYFSFELDMTTHHENLKNAHDLSKLKDSDLNNKFENEETTKTVAKNRENIRRLGNYSAAFIGRLERLFVGLTNTLSS